MSTIRFQAATAALIVASLCASAFAHVSDQMKDLLALPAVGGFFAALLQLWQDYLARRHELDLQATEHAHALSVASHMAQVNFDKHVAFAEEYLAAVLDATSTLFVEGPTSRTADLAAPLLQIRRKYLPWLSRQLEEELIPFENALQRMGANEHLLKSVRAGEKRTRLVDETYKLFGIVLGHEKEISEEQKRMTIASIVERLRALLGTSQLTKLRENSFELAMERRK